VLWAEISLLIFVVVVSAAAVSCLDARKQLFRMLLSPQC
jgi:hypothetical protein